MDQNTKIIVDCLEIGGIGIIMMVLAYLWRLKYEVEGYRRYARSEEKGWKKYIWILLVLGAALVFKLILAAYYEGHETDMNCFYGWSDMIYENGFGKFYSLDAFTDYPPGYMAILWVVEAVQRLFSIETASVASRVLTKLVPVLADLGAGFVLWRMAKEKFSEGSSCLIAIVYVISPIVLMDSSVWGQTDSVFTLCVLLTGYLCMKKKRIPAYFIFVIGAFIKPQTIIFAPLIIWTFIEQVILEDFSWKKLATELVGGLCAIGSFFVMAIPFGVGAVVKQYMETLGQYEYGSVNAYNIWAMFGKNWASQDDLFLGLSLKTWGMVAIPAAVFLSGFAFYRLKKKNDMSRYFISMAVVIITMFLFSVRMHERYMFPAIVLLLAAFIIKPTREMFGVYTGFSFMQFMNVGHVYKNNVVNGMSTAPSGGIIGITAMLSIGLYGYMWFAMNKDTEILPFSEPIKSKGRRAKVSYAAVKDEDEKPVREKREHFSIKASKKMPKFTKYDWIVLFSIIIVYSAFALFNLGNTYAPQTEWSNDGDMSPLVFDLGENKHVDMVYMYLGHNVDRRFTLDLSEDGVSYETAGELTAHDVFHWDPLKNADDESTPPTYNLIKDYRYLQLTPLDADSFVREIVIVDQDRHIFTPVNASEYPALFDEQEMFEYPATYRSGTYFDEIYHARTAQEMIDGQYNYENTHPPLGKFLIGLGVRVFGMTPFGWRIVGVLFGIGMLPLMFLFARRLFDARTWAAGAATGLFAFDFMHFAQTRIATIDVYGTFFIIAMFYFIYKYSQTSFYDTKLWKTFLPLLGAALSMGFGCASKWTAVYATAGMGIFFFYTMFKRFREYRAALADPEGTTDGISHAHIIEVWWKYLFITLGVCVVLFIGLAGLIYLLSYIPFSNGTDMGLWDRMIKNQIDMFDYHSTLEATHPFSSVWYEWPIMARPVYYYSGTTLSGLKEGMSGFGNPLVWWAGIPAFFYMIYRGIRYSDGKALFLSYAYGVQMLPWMLVSRCTFAYHYFPSVPFVTMMIVYVMVKLDTREEKHWRKWIYVYLGAAFFLFVFFYPVLTGIGVEESFARDALRWLPGWVLC